MKDASKALGGVTTALVIILTLVAVVGAGHAGNMRLGAVFGATFLAVYLGGALSEARLHENWDGVAAVGPTRKWGILWLLGMGFAWVGLLVVSGTAMWIAFPLILLQFGVLGLGWGSVAAFLVAGASSVVALVHLPEGDSMVGPVLGPALGVLIAVAFMWGVAAVGRESRARQEALDQLTETRALLADAEAERVASRERQRLAGELHDTVVQGISAVGLLLNAAEQQPPGPRRDALIDQALDATKENLLEARRITTTLGPAELNAGRLPEALRSLADRPRLSGLSMAEVRVVIEGEPDLSLPDEVALLRVAQSGLWNAHEHSQAANIQVTLTSGPEGTVLEVLDDGVGFQEGPGQDGRGSGIPTMEARMSEVGGTLQIASTEEGTTVTASVPRNGAQAKDWGKD